MGNKQQTQFSPVTQDTFDADRYSGMWYKVYDSVNSASCDSTIVFCFLTGDILNITEYCVVGSALKGQVQRTAVAHNPHDPCKFELKTKGSFGAKQYWIYYTNYTTYSLVGSGVPNAAGNGSDFVILSRSPAIPEAQQREVRNKAIQFGLVANIPYPPQ